MFYKLATTYIVTQIREVEIDEALARKVNWRLSKWLVWDDIPTVTVSEIEDCIFDDLDQYGGSVEVYNAHLPEYCGELPYGTSTYGLGYIIKLIVCEIVEGMEPVDEIVEDWVGEEEEIIK